MSVNWSELSRAGCRVQPDVALKDFTTFRLGGPCRAVVTCSDEDSLVRAVTLLAGAGEPFLLIGGGSNLLVADEGYDGVIVRSAAEALAVRREGVMLEVSGCSPLDPLAAYAVEQGLDGLTYASGIPGTVGGAVAGNAGAFGKQIGDAVVSVRLMDVCGNVRSAPASELGFAYRQSRLQETGETVLSVQLQLVAGDAAELRRQRQDILALRREKHPDWRVLPTAGSFFKNVEPTSSAGRRQAAGWFLEQVGAKTMRVGGARVFEKHANIIVAEPGCRARDVVELSRRMSEAVRRQFGLDLVREVRLIGRFE